MKRVVALTGALVAMLASTASAAQLYAPNSVWNKQLGASEPLAPNSTAISAELLEAANEAHAAGSGPWMNTDTYSTAIVQVPANQARVPVTLNSWRAGTPMQDWLDEGIPIPNNLSPSTGSDAHITVWQPSTDKVWSCWDSHDNGSSWTAGTCQGSEHVSTSSGYATVNQWPPFSNSGAPSYDDGHSWTSTATALPVEGGTVTPAQLENGVGHALALDLPNVCVNYYVWPAQRNDGGAATGDCVPEGAKFQLRQNYTCTALSNGAAETLCQAAKNKGMIVRDSAPSVGFYAEDVEAKGQADPYYGAGGLFENEWPTAFLDPARFPWSEMKLLKNTVCTNDAVPCPAP